MLAIPKAYFHHEVVHPSSIMLHAFLKINSQHFYCKLFTCIKRMQETKQKTDMKHVGSATTLQHIEGLV